MSDALNTASDVPAQVAASPRLDLHPDGLAVVTFDDPERSVNVLSEAVLRRLDEVVGELATRARAGDVRGVAFRSGKKGSFIVGADIEEIASIEDPEQGAEAARFGQRLYLAIERLPVPTLAVVNGTCMGGGTELALACSFRILTDHPKASMGLPEVQLGILPGWGGTTRLPRLIGLQSALDLLLTGKTVRGRRARSMGLVEEIVPQSTLDEDPEELFRHYLFREPPVRTGARRSILQRALEDTAPGRAIVLRKARTSVLEKTGGNYPAPLRILEVVRDSLGRPVEKALEIEAEGLGELLASRVSKHLVHVFHLREGARKGTGLEGWKGDAAATKDVEPHEVSELGVVGAGVMGGGIAQLAAEKGIQVRMKDIRHDAVAGGLRHARSLFDRSVEKRRMPRREADQAMERISGGVDYGGFGQLDLVVEAVVEKLEVKRSVFREVEERVPEECILASNTSTLSIAEMASAVARPRNLCGMHFFNPVHKMPLVEVIRGPKTGPGAVATVYALALRMGKVPVVVGDGPGFVVNRILGPYLNEAGHLLAEGASIDAIDAAATAFGLPMGPLRLVDEVGIDIARHAGDLLHQAFGAERMTPSAPMVAIGETDRLGLKGGSGFYRYENGRAAGPDPEVYALLGGSVPLERTPLPEDDIRARLLLVMINEAVRILDEGIAHSAADVDLAMIMGTGFPPFRGGLLRFADEMHPRVLVQRLRTYEAELGPRFAPAEPLVRLAEADRTFYEHWPARR
jgi:3-hydroxyacyl-CoA dehydrogenase / enoyl-CoA hydratase / 3-hydroxybutyryl-CoA epimerase